MLVVIALLLLTFALPVRVWRTGELPAAPLPLVPGDSATHPRRIWIDTDAACGLGRRTDPDDCFAILLLITAPGVTVAGISTVHGNAPLAETDSVTRELVRQLPADGRPHVYRGHAGAGDSHPAPADIALARALAEGPLTVVALGPLTNIAPVSALPTAEGLDVVAVMGRRPGHLFHPSEGAGGGMLLGHGPVFTDFNFAQDPAAAARTLRSGVPLTLVPYDAAREISLAAADLERIADASRPGAWIAERAREWLGYWNEDIGRQGFYPFDLVGAAFVLRPDLFGCARAAGWIGKDRRMWGWLGRPTGFLVDVAVDSAVEARASGPVRYCPELSPRLHGWLLLTLTSGAPLEAGSGGSRPSS